MKVTKFYQKKINQNYIKNILDAQVVFARYLNTDIYNALSELGDYLWFRDSLKAQHKVMIRRGYKGNTKSSMTNRPIINALRDEPEFHYRRLNKPKLKKEWYKKELKKYKLQPNQIICPKIDYVPRFAWHQVSNLSDGLLLSLPDNHFLQYYLIPMARIMRKLKSYIRAYHGSTVKHIYEIQILKLLGQYIHLFIVGHPFEKVNFSLCMMQVNYILNRTIGKSIYHEFLDFKCFMNDTDTIINEFKSMVKRSRK